MDLMIIIDYFCLVSWIHATKYEFPQQIRVFEHRQLFDYELVLIQDKLSYR
jgi:hypothetical protein